MIPRKRVLHALCVLVIVFTHQSPSNYLAQCQVANENKYNEVLDLVASRGATSSQVIEYNPRNIAIMTLLNSLLILGGLLGTFTRASDLPTPFKRVDFSRIKRKFSFKKNKNILAPPPVAPSDAGGNVAPSSSPFLMANPSADHLLLDPQLARPFRTLVPTTHETLLASLAGGGGSSLASNKNAFRFAASTQLPPMPYELTARRNDEIINETGGGGGGGGARVSLADNSPSPREVRRARRCEHVLYCLDKLANNLHTPSLTGMSATAMKLLNLAIGTREHPQLMRNVQELIELDQKSACVVNLVCTQADNGDKLEDKKLMATKPHAS